MRLCTLELRENNIDKFDLTILPRVQADPLAKHADCKKVFIANSLAVTSVRLFGHFTTSDIVDLNK